MHRGRRKNKTQKKHRGREFRGFKHVSEWNPPPMKSQPPRTMKIAYNASTSQTDTISGADILSLVVMATSATTTARIFASVRIKKIEAWTPVRISNTTTPFDPIDFGIEWFGTTGQATNSVKDFFTSMGIKPGYMIVKPPPHSQSGEWIIQSGLFDNANTMFTLNVPQGALIHFTFQFVLVDNEAANAGETSSGMVLGTVYYAPLDGRSSNNLLANGGVRDMPFRLAQRREEQTLEKKRERFSKEF